MSLGNTAPEAIALWRRDPVRFVFDMYGPKMDLIEGKWKGPDPWQWEALSALPYKNNIALKACKGPGKTCYEAWALQWMMFCFPHTKGLCTSITGENLRDNLWAELAKWLNMSPLLSECFGWTAERFYEKEHPETWFISARKWSKTASPKEQANTLAGLHGDYTIVCVDEAGDIPSAVTTAIDASQSTGKKNVIIIAGNPSRTDGPLYDACIRDRHIYHVVEITGDPEDPRRSSRISKEWAQREIEKWGREDPFVMTNVLGRFPHVQSDKFLGEAEVAEAAKRSYNSHQLLFYPTIYGLDVARFGDNKSVLFKRIGPVAFKVREWRGINTMDLVQQVIGVWFNEKGDSYFVDSGGLGGPVVDRFRELNYPVVGIDFGSSPSNVERFVDKRTEMWWGLRDWIRSNGSIPDDPDLKRQLVAPTYDYKISKGKGSRLVLESKEDMKSRGIPSPDDADALCLTFALPVPMKQVSHPGLPQQTPQCAYEYNPLERAA